MTESKQASLVNSGTSNAFWNAWESTKKFVDSLGQMQEGTDKKEFLRNQDLKQAEMVTQPWESAFEIFRTNPNALVLKSRMDRLWTFIKHYVDSYASVVQNGPHNRLVYRRDAAGAIASESVMIDMMYLSNIRETIEDELKQIAGTNTLLQAVKLNIPPLE